MKSKRTLILFVLFLAAAGLAAVRQMPHEHPDAMSVLRSGCDDYAPLVRDGEAQPGIYTHRMLNGLLIHVRKTSDGYEPILGVYMNAEGAKVHVENKNGIAAVHTHALIPEYVLGRTTMGGINASMKQIPPDRYDKGPSRFLLRFAKRYTKGRLFGHVEHEGEIIAAEQEATELNSNHRGLIFPNPYTDFPAGSQLCVRFELDGQATEATFPVHDLPPRETLSRTLFLKEDTKPRFE